MIEGKNIVITGCLHSIGRKTLEVFAADGANVFACAHRQDNEFETFCRELAEKYDVTIRPIYFDMMDSTSVNDAVRSIQQTEVEIHGLINTYSINKNAYFGMITYQDMLDTFQVNFFSQIIWVQYIVDLMRRRGTRGSVVLTSSITAMDGSAGQMVYGASKAALNGAAKTMALELGKSGIRVNTVALGFIKTTMVDALSEENINMKIKVMDIPRLGTAEDVANLYLFLMSDLSGHISGQIIRVDGGIR